MGKLEVLLSEPYKSDKPQHEGHRMQIRAEISQGERGTYTTMFAEVDLDRGERPVSWRTIDRLSVEDAEKLTSELAVHLGHPITEVRPAIEFEGEVLEAAPPGLRALIPPASEPWWATPGRQSPDQPIPGARPPVPYEESPWLWNPPARWHYWFFSVTGQIQRDLWDSLMLPPPRGDEAPPPARGTTQVEAVVVADTVGVLAWATHHRATAVSSVDDLIARVEKDARRGDVSRLVIIDHGNTDGIQIGSDNLGVGNLELYEQQLETLSAYLDRETGYVFFENCQVGHNLRLLSRISTILKVPVYAGTGYTAVVYRVNYGEYVRCDPDGQCATNVPRPPHSIEGPSR
jgi:hypothetical protein